ncbi:hypothetical protein F4778DRAFT_751236 [Xylariomycetidae sp. FL2044]|nr:hypothetical protein F4778DRAFT_751236 [Xylariomycetidae sp. FL2044]
MAENYVIRVTAGSDYDIEKHTIVPVNSPETVKISNEFIDVELNVRVQDYHGLPRNSPTTSPYFSQEPHSTHNDRYSIAIQFTPKKPAPGTASAAASRSSSVTRHSNKVSSRASSIAAKVRHRRGSSASHASSHSGEDVPGISGHDLQFGNDFDHPIRDRLPPGFSYAMNIVKWWIDPGLEGDAYADQPYLYGPALSSFNAVHVGPGDYDPTRGGLCFGEGGDDAGLKARRAIGVPETGKDRMKWGLKNEHKEKWVFEYGKTYCVDFFNPYLDFNEFSLRLPGFHLPIMKYWDGQGLRNSNKPRKRSHTLRYVLRNRSTGDTYLVILFSLYLKEDVNEDGSLKPAALQAMMEDKSMAKESGKIVGGDNEAKGRGKEEGDKDYEAARRHFKQLNLSAKEGDERKISVDDDVD